MSHSRPTSPAVPPADARQIQAQADYFDARAPVRMHAVDTPYVRRHFEEVYRSARLAPGESVCEWGAGMGRFTRLFATRGHPVTAIELSGERAEDCRRTVSDHAHARVLAGDIADVLARDETRYDVVVGFFVLHHLPELDRYLRAARTALRPGGRIVFAEPNPFNPLYPVQITLAPTMRWEAERGIYRLWPGQIRHAVMAAGFEPPRIERYGALPRLPYNVAARIGCEKWPERITPTFLKAFQLIVART